MASNLEVGGVKVEGTAGANVSIISGATSHGSVFFGDAGDAEDGVLGYDQNERKMYIKTAGDNAKRLTVDSAGVLGVPASDGGTESTTLSTNAAGHTLFGNDTANRDMNYTVTGTGGHYFSTGGLNSASIAASGLATFGYGIAFTQTGTAATGAATTSSTLDHYEEGTWTPVIQDLAGNVATCSVAVGSFTRIGNRVLVGFQVTLTSIGSMTGSYVLISGLPFNHVANTYNGTGNIDVFTNFDTSYSGLSLDTSSTASLLWLTGTAAGGGASQVYVPVSALGGNELFKGGAQYYV